MVRFFRARAIALLCIAWFCSSCAMYSIRSRGVRNFFESGNYPAAIEELKKLAATEDNDQLLYLMDLGLIYHTAGMYKEAIEVFLKADKLAEIKDYTSLTQEAASIALNEQVKPYKGEDFEKILIHVYLAIDFTLSHQYESALVECRRVNHILDQMISKGQLPYERNAFAKYLAGSLFEAQGEINDAFVDYRQLLKWNPSTPYLGVPLLRLSDRMKATQEFDEFQKKFPNVKDYKLGKEYGEIVLLLEVGRSPVKIPSPAFHRMPAFQRRMYGARQGILKVDDSGASAYTEDLFDIESTAIRELEHRLGLILAKKVAGIVVKELIAQQVKKSTNSELAGALTSLILHVTDQPDLRSWSTLPAKLQIARLRVPAGRHSVSLDIVPGSPRGRKRWADVDVKPGKIVFLNYRAMD